MLKFFIPLLMALVLTVFQVTAAERKPFKNIDTNELVKETQVMPAGSGNESRHIAMTWWIPNEFWEIILERNATTSAADKKAMLNALSGISLLAVVQADVSLLGAFDYYSKEEVEEKMAISYVDAAEKKQRIAVVRSPGPDLEVVLGVFKPILAAAMGNFGDSFHFYVLNDRSVSSARVLDPYKEGVLTVELAKRSGERMRAEVEMPLNALFIPRKCPNGKEAHISWKYCPWTGEKL